MAVLATLLEDQSVSIWIQTGPMEANIFKQMK